MHGARPHYLQYFARIESAVGDGLPLLNFVSVLDSYALVRGNEVLFDSLVVFVRAFGDYLQELLLAARSGHFNYAVYARHFRRFLGPAGLKEFRNARQTAGDVLRLGG